MRTVGLIGGMSWHSTLLYYRHINEIVGDRAGGLHSAPVLLSSLDFHPIVRLQRLARWTEAADLLIDAAVCLEQAGASAVLLGTTTMHLVAPQIEAALGVPFIHIADVTAHAIKQHRLKKVGLLGTSFTMRDGFYRNRFAQNHSLEVITPGPADADEISRIIFEELCRGVVLDRSRRRYNAIIDRLTDRGAEGIILGCTEIPMLVDQGDRWIPVFDTTRIHAQSAAEFILAPTPRPSLVSAR